MPTFRDFVKDRVPPWLDEYWGLRYTRGLIGYIADCVLEGATQAIKAPWLRSNTSPSDALPVIAHERNIRRVAMETDDSFRIRLANAWVLWGEAGTVTFADNALEPLGLDPADVTIMAQKDWTAPPDTTDFFSRFWVICEDPAPWTQLLWGGFVWSDGSTWGSSATHDEVISSIQVIWDWKAGHEVPVSILLAWDWFWGWGVWGAPAGVWGTHIATWPAGKFWGVGYPSFVWGGVELLTTSVAASWGCRPSVAT